jgi:hypothetical protein
MKWLTVVALLLSGVAARAGEETADAERELLAGDQAFKAGHWDAAIVHFDAARRLAPDRSAPYRYLGLSYAKLGRCKEAVPPLEEYLRRKKDASPDAVVELDRCRAVVADEEKRRIQHETEDQQRRAQLAEEERKKQAELESQGRREREAIDAAAKSQREAAHKIEREHEQQIADQLLHDRIDVCDINTNPNVAAGPTDFWFCHGGGSMTENEFIRRFEALTGSREAHWALRLRNKTTLIVSAVLGAGGVAIAAWGLSRPTRPCNPVGDAMNDNCLTGGVFDPSKSTLDLLPLLVGLGGATLWLVTTAVVAGSRYDGTFTDHDLSRVAAVAMAAKYNAALEANIRAGRPATTPVRPKPRVEVTPYLGGVVGRF